MSLPVTRRAFVRLAGAFSTAARWPQAMKSLPSQSSDIELPPDLPIAQTPPSSAEWLKQAITLQPWGITQFKAITGFRHLPAELKREFGFNAIILLPADAHNGLSDAVLPPGDAGRMLIDPGTKLTEAQFREGWDAYRKEGYRTILYSSVMHCGHAPIWQSGQLAREHPDWLQRDATGQTIGAFGQAWLCPSSPARAFTLAYTVKLVTDYSPDAIMLDNNGFAHTATGFTCYCEYCQKGFKDYVQARCGRRWIRQTFQIDPDQLRIPTDRGPLLSLWLVWRSRVWAETDELFRAELRRHKPDIAFFVNIQYDANPDTQGTRLQFVHEDVIFSETHESDSWYISQKLVLGQSLVPDSRPVWNYVATFRDANPVRLRPKDEVSLMMATSLAHKTLPWINYPGLDSAEDVESRREIAKYTLWFASQPELHGGNLVSPVGSVLSLLNRDVFESIKLCRKQGVTGCSPSEETPALLTGHVRLLLQSGMPVRTIRESDLSSGRLDSFRILTLFNIRVLSAQQAQVLSAWVKDGGTLIATPDSGAYSQLALPLPTSTMWDALGVEPISSGSRAIGSGTLQISSVNSFDEAVLSSVRQAGLAFMAPKGVEVVCREDKDRYYLHIVRHQANGGPATITVPSWLRFAGTKCPAFSPDWTQPREVVVQPASALDISDFPTYGIIALKK